MVEVYGYPVGTRIIHKDGYIRIKLPDHPLAKSGWVPEHRVVMMNMLRRLPEPYECAHHMNHNRADNSYMNILPMESGEHNQLHSKYVSDKQKNKIVEYAFARLIEVWAEFLPLESDPQPLSDELGRIMHDRGVAPLGAARGLSA